MRPYRPSNGMEGADFIERWCGRCKRDEAYRNGEGDSCPIVANTFVFRADDPRYPKEWVDDEHGQKCTAFDDTENPPRQDTNAAIGDLFEGKTK